MTMIHDAAASPPLSRDGADGTFAAPLLSLIVPVYRNEDNIPSLLAAVERMNTAVGGLEAIFVVDGSPDASGENLIKGTAEAPYPVKIIFHSRNFGSFAAIRTGLEYASGEYFAAMAADLQEPPELIEKIFAVLKSDGADVVFGQREGRNDSPLRDFLSKAFWWTYRTLVNRDMPRGGVDIFGCNKEARSALLSIEEPNSSLVAQLFWIGFRRRFIPYQRQTREIGTSAWGFARRLRYMMDSILTFSDLPILIVLWVGVLGSVFSLIFSVAALIGRLTGAVEIRGYTTLVLLITFFGSLSLLVNGLIGSYIWRTFENTKQRPLRIVSRILAAGTLQRTNDRKGEP